MAPSRRHTAVGDITFLLSTLWIEPKEGDPEVPRAQAQKDLGGCLFERQRGRLRLAAETSSEGWKGIPFGTELMRVLALATFLTMPALPERTPSKPLS